MKLGKEEKGKPCLEKPSPDANWFIWDGIRGTRANQDYQREVEDTSLLDIQSHLAGRRQGKLVRVSSNEASSYHSGGSFLRLEQVGFETSIVGLEDAPCMHKISCFCRIGETHTWLISNIRLP